ncbi:MAG: ankyrin repeat domain-containing protein [Spiroplasma sp. hy2]|uniref:ankyrin repeat domain-containing protein n=1 Tax=Spiroplasma sp. hy2 TaxID=2490850 RepID=UPI003848543A
MKKLLVLLGTIIITGNVIPSIIAAAPNKKHNIKKRQNNENTSTTPKMQDDQQFPDIIEKEIILDENYSNNIQKILQELIDKNYIDPLRSINMGGLISKELDNKTIIYKLEELEPKMANWFKNQQNNKDKILILTLKNSNNESVKLVINLNNLYLLGFINNQNKYFYFDDELLKRIEQINQEEITKLNNLKDKLNNLKENKLLFNEKKVQEYLQQKNELIPLKAKEKDNKKLNYNNELNSLNKKISNLQGENLKDDEEKIKTINNTVIKKYIYQKINLNYTGAYSEDGLNVVIKQNRKPEGKDIFISQDTLNNAIANLSKYDNNKQENQTIKDDLVRMIFITSEAIRFQCDEKTLEIFANIKNIDELQKIIAGSQNILKNIQEKVFDKKENINWKDYTSQLRGDWKKYSEQLNKFRIEIWENLIKTKKIIDFINKNKVDINNILKTKNNINKKIQELFNKKENKNFIEIKNECLKYILKITKSKEMFKFIISYFEKEWKLKTDFKTDDEFFLLNYNNDNDILYIFIIKNNLDLAKLLINLNPNKKMINSIDINHTTPLFLAINNGNINFVKFLLKNGADVNFQGKIGSMLIINAININNLEIVDIIFNYGADVNLQDPLANNTYLHIAARNGQLELVKLLLSRGANPNMQEKKGITPLYFAAQSDKTEVVQELLTNKNSKNKIDINLSNDLGDTPLHIASFNGNYKIVELLLKNHKIDVNKKDDCGDSALIVAARNGKINVVKKLLKHSDIDVNLSNERGLTALHYACENGHLIIVKLLLSNNANLNYQDDEGNDPLDLAEENNHKEIVNLLKKHKKLNENIKKINKILQKNQDEQQENIKILEETKKELKQLLKIELADVITETGFLNSYPKTDSNVNTNAEESQSQGSGSKRTSVSEQTRTSGTQSQNTKTKNQNIMYDVPGDDSCLFWSVATSYLLPLRNNNEEFKNRFIQLFGEENLKYLQLIQKLLKQYNLENHSNNQLWYNDEIAIRLVTNVFRNRVVDYIETNLDNPTQSNINNNQAESFRRAIEISQNGFDVGEYLKGMRNINTWGGEIEILAMGNILNVNINENNIRIFTENNEQNTNTIQIFHVNNRTHYNFSLLENIEVSNTNSQETTTTVKNQQKLTEEDQPKANITISNKSTKNNNNNVPVPSANKPININIANSQETKLKKAVNKYNSLSKEEKQKKLNEINQHYQSLPENEQKAFKDKLIDVGSGLTSSGISGAGILGISKMTGISPIKGLSTTANYIKNILSTTPTVVSSETGEAVEMTPLLSESSVAEGGLTAAETLSVTEGSVVVATEGTAVIGTEAGTAAALAPETLGLSLVIGGLVIAGTAILWWINSDHTIVKHESHNQYNEIEKYYKFLTHDQLKLDITINKWDKIKQIYQENSNNYQEFKNQIKSEITNFHKEDHSGWGGSITDNDINTLINIIYNHFQEINNHFLSNPNHGWKIVTNTISSYFIIEEE